MTIIRNKTNPNSAKMQKNDTYVKRNLPGSQFVAYWENLRSGHTINPVLAYIWIKKGIASVV